MKQSPLILRCGVLALAFAAAMPAAAKSVFLNGVNIDGVTDQKFDGCTVAIDAQGNVFITAKGYEVETVPAAPAPAAPAPAPAPTTTKPAAPLPAAAPAPPVAVTKRYFLVSETAPSGTPQYDIDVFVNAVWIKRITGDEPQVVLDISRHLHAGKNAVHFTALKAVRDGRRSSSAQSATKIVLGEGTMAGNNVVIDVPLLEYRRDASETQNYSDERSITAR